MAALDSRSDHRRSLLSATGEVIMHRNSPKFPPVILLICFVITVFTSTQAQKNPGNAQGVAPVIFLDSSKEQDGLVGPVRRVQTEMSRLDTRSGAVTEGPRQLLEVTTYDLKGKRIDNVSYPLGGPTGTEEYKYDDKGNIVEMTLKGKDGTIISREVYAYEMDGVGNWTKMTTSLVLFEDGALRYEPVEVTYRTIAYFYDETIAKLLGSSLPASNPPPSSIQISPPLVTAEASTPASKRSDSPTTNPVLDAPNTKPTVDSSLLKSSEAEKRPTESKRMENRPETSKAPITATDSNAVGVRAAAENTVRPNTAAPAKEIVSGPNSHKAAFDFYKSGREQFSMGNLDGAIEAYQHAIELEPGFSDVYLSLGHAYLRQQKSKEAIKAFKEATRLNPDMDEAHYGLGLEYFRGGNMKDASQAFKKAVKANPNLAKAHYGLALSYQEMGKQDLLLEEFRILQDLDPQLAKKLSDTFPESNLPCNGRRCD